MKYQFCLLLKSVLQRSCFFFLMYIIAEKHKYKTPAIF